jgi:hypothetical protein
MTADNENQAGKETKPDLRLAMRSQVRLTLSAMIENHDRRFIAWDTGKCFDQIVTSALDCGCC